MANESTIPETAANEADRNTDQFANQAKSGVDRAANAAKQATESFRQGADKARETFQDKVVDPAKRAGEAMKASGQKLAEGGSTIGRTMIDQAESNAHQAFAAMRRAAEAKDISEVMKIQGDYLREQGTRSMSQAREIGELIMQFGRDAVAPLKGAGE